MSVRRHGGAGNENGRNASIPAFRPRCAAAGFAARAARRSGQAGLLEQLGHDPALGLRDGTRFSDLDQVAHLVLALFVMGVVLARAAGDLAVQLVRVATLDEDRDGLRTLVADDAAHEGTRIGLRLFGRGGLGLRHFAAPFFSARMVLARAMSRRVFFSCGGVVSCWGPFFMRRAEWGRRGGGNSLSRARAALGPRSDAFFCFVPSLAEVAA